ncbi:GNAT family N-acetyltransferase [Micromonospora sp. KC723]|uniref:GNAT family N-acetyltransferase n=1 Tax=Micromonospora sp. KC723 TaxID=2530381 RepID=UPI001048E240|nr:GNAT family N-acetyltransferase [Micromonospora sp. KC723]TDB78462.1 N-acetyltransferase [Micromonospora sp. KC723]
MNDEFHDSLLTCTRSVTHCFACTREGIKNAYGSHRRVRRDGGRADAGTRRDRGAAHPRRSRNLGIAPAGHRQIIERDSGLVGGSIGLFWPPIDGALEIRYGVVLSRCGRGHAPEAVRALSERAFTAPGVDGVYANVDLSNPASVRVLEKVGFQRTRTEQDIARYRVVPPARQ